VPARSPLEISRRELLLGGTAAAAGALLLGACGGDDGADSSSTTVIDTSGPALASFFGGPMFVAGQEARLPFGVADQDGLLPIDQTPTQLAVQVVGPDGDAVGEPITVDRRSDGLPRGYFPLRVTVDEPGIYAARTEVDGKATEMSFQILDPADAKVIRPGQAMPAVDTPTVTDARGVDPICTREPACPLHDRTVSEALTMAKPLALLVASPAFCQIAICGPVLDVMLGVQADFPGITFLHAEVYAHPTESLDTNAAVVDALGLHFEPCLVLVDGAGQVVDRLDTIFDATELVERLGRL
jgi:hypothetical protein